MGNEELLQRVNRYYSDKIIRYGATSEGVDWNGPESHRIRFEQLCRILPDEKKFSLLDYGCGFGSLIEYLAQKKIPCQYYGFDISKEMIEKAEKIYPTSPEVNFMTELPVEFGADYTIANGIFNVRLETQIEDWKRYIEDTLEQINACSRRGFSFNILTSYSDAEYMKDYLYYADPAELFHFCKSKFSKNVALLHDYELYEFTLLVRK